MPAELVAYSGFSPTNYIQEPYSPDLDFGTGEWNIGSWVNIPDTANLGGNLLRNDTIGTYAGSTRLLAEGPTGVTEYVGQFGDGTNSFFAFSAIPSIVPPISGRRSTISIWVKIISDTSGASGSIDFYHYAGGTTDGMRSFTAAGNGIGTWFQLSRSGINGGTDAQFRINIPAGMIVQVTRLLYQYGSTIGEFVDSGTSSQVIIKNSIQDRRYSSGPYYNLYIDSKGFLGVDVNDGATTLTTATTAYYNTGTWLKASAHYQAGRLSINVNGREVASTFGAPLKSLSSRYNLLNYSEQFDNAAWTKAGVTVTANAVIAPDSTTTADKIVATNTASTTRAVYESITPISGQIYTASFYVKAAEYDLVAIQEIGGGRFGASFNLTAQTATSLGGAGYISSTITDAGSGWFRCSVVWSGGASGAAITVIGYPLGATVTAAGTAYAGDGVSGIYVWGAQLNTESTVLTYQRTTTVAETGSLAPLTIGNSYALNAPFPGSLALLKLSATVPTPEQSIWMYEQEKMMFQADAKCCLPDSGALVDLSYDDATDSWIAVSATNESTWTGLVRTSTTPVSAGSHVKVSTSSGVKLNARKTTVPGVDVTVPDYNLRTKALGRRKTSSKTLATFDYVGGFTATTTTGMASLTSVAGLSYPTSYVGAVITGTGIPAGTYITTVSGTTLYLSAAATATGTTVQISFTDFVLPAGMEAKLVMTAGTLKQEGSTKDWTRLYDGFKESVRFAVAPGYTAWVQIQASKAD